MIVRCDYCKAEYRLKKSAFERRKRHFCSRACYSKYRTEIMPPEEQNSYGTGYSAEERERRRKAREIICVTSTSKNNRAKCAETKRQKHTMMIIVSRWR